MTSAFLCSTLSADNSQTVCEIGNLRIKWKIHFHSLISHTTIDNATTARWFANHNGSRLNGLDDDCFPSIFFALILFFFCCLCLIFHYGPRTVDVGIFFLPAPIDQKKTFSLGNWRNSRKCDGNKNFYNLKMANFLASLMYTAWWISNDKSRLTCGRISQLTKLSDDIEPEISFSILFSFRLRSLIQFQLMWPLSYFKVAIFIETLLADEIFRLFCKGSEKLIIESYQVKIIEFAGPEKILSKAFLFKSRENKLIFCALYLKPLYLRP